MTHWRAFLAADAKGGRYLPWKEVARATGLSRTTAWRLQKRDDFPAPYAISPGRVGYREEEVEAWKVSRDHSGARTARAEGEGQAPAAGPRPAAARPLPVPHPQRPRDERAPAPAAPSPAQGKPGPAPGPPPSSKARRRRSQHAKAIAQQMLLDF